jgi:hypothetical protein
MAIIGYLDAKEQLNRDETVLKETVHPKAQSWDR